MFNDLLTSSKGPGVIGTFLALIVLVGFGLLTMFATQEGSGNSLASKVKDKEKSINNLTASLKNWQERANLYAANRASHAELEAIQSKLEARKKGIAIELKNLQAFKQKLTDKQAEFEQYKKHYRIAERASAIGEEMESLTTQSGVTYKKVRILEISPLETRIRHEYGSKRIRYDDLPLALQDRFQFTKEDAETRQKEMDAQVARSQEGKKDYTVSKEIVDLKSKIHGHRAEITTLERQLRSAEASIASNKSRIKSERERAQHYRELYSNGRRGLTLDKAKKAAEKADSLSRKNATLRQRVSQYRASIQKETNSINDGLRRINELQAKAREKAKENSQ